MKKKCQLCDKEAEYFKVAGIFNLCKEHFDKMVQTELKNSDIIREGEEM